MVIVPFRRRGIAEGRIYTAVVYPTDDGWRWAGHERLSDAIDTSFGPIIASGGPFEFDTGAAREAELWFKSIPRIVEMTPAAYESATAI